jgi:hypothetical protein
VAIAGIHSPRAITTSWLTPPAILDALGGADSFDLDPCAAPEPRPWPTARHHISLPVDGLLEPWHGRIWLNPPYGAAVGRWLSKLADHGQGTALIFARTETASFAAHVWKRATALLFLEGRLHFHLADGNRARCNSGGPSCLIAYGADDARVLRASGLPGAFVLL